MDVESWGPNACVDFVRDPTASKLLSMRRDQCNGNPKAGHKRWKLCCSRGTN